MTAEKWSSIVTEMGRLVEDILERIKRRVEDNQELIIGACMYARAKRI
jgi:hypothetical protein